MDLTIGIIALSLFMVMCWKIEHGMLKGTYYRFGKSHPIFLSKGWMNFYYWFVIGGLGIVYFIGWMLK